MSSPATLFYARRQNMPQQHSCYLNGDLLALMSEAALHLSKFDGGFGDNSSFVGAPRKSTLKSDLVIRSMIKTAPSSYP